MKLLAPIPITTNVYRHALKAKLVAGYVDLLLFNNRCINQLYTTIAILDIKRPEVDYYVFKLAVHHRDDVDDIKEITIGILYSTNEFLDTEARNVNVDKLYVRDKDMENAFYTFISYYHDKILNNLTWNKKGMQYYGYQLAKMINIPTKFKDVIVHYSNKEGYYFELINPKLRTKNFVYIEHGSLVVKTQYKQTKALDELRTIVFDEQLANWYSKFAELMIDYDNDWFSFQIEDDVDEGINYSQYIDEEHIDKYIPFVSFKPATYPLMDGKYQIHGVTEFLPKIKSK